MSTLSTARSSRKKHATFKVQTPTRSKSTARKSTRSTTWQTHLRNPWATLASAILGIYIGTLNRPLAEFIAPLGTVYLGMLKMCVLPILLSGITMSIGRLMRTSNAAEYLRRIGLVFPIGLVIASAIATTIAVIAGPGRNLPTATLSALGGLINTSGIDLEISLTGGMKNEAAIDVTNLLLSVVPENIFNALSEGQTLKVLVFSIIFGAALGIVQDEITEVLFGFLESVYKACNKLLQGLTLLLPFGLCSLLAIQFSKLGFGVLIAMLKFVVIAILTYVVIYIISTLVIWRQSNSSLWQVLQATKEPTILAIATTSSLTCIPYAIATLSNDLKFNRQATNLVTPLSITICRFGSVIYFAMASIFVQQLYGKELNLETIAITVLGSILAGMATSGVTSVLTLTMLDLVLTPLKLPLEAVLVLFIAIDPLMDPFRTVAIVHSGMAATSVITDLATTEDDRSENQLGRLLSRDNFIDNIATPERD